MPPFFLTRAIESATSVFLSPAGADRAEWRPVIFSNRPLPIFYRASSWGYSVVGALLIIFAEQMRACDEGFWWRAVGAGLFVQGFLSYQSDVAMWGRHDAEARIWKLIDPLLASTLTVMVGPVICSRMALGVFTLPEELKHTWTLGVVMAITSKLMGARAALIEIRGNDFKVQTPDQGSVSKRARSWGGIPLDWAGALFMNQIPCPDLASPGLAWSLTSEGVLQARTRDGVETWSYRIAPRMGFSFVEKVTWQKRGQAPFELTREDPDPADGWARRWEIKSGVGEVKVRWRDRKSL
jgi:hypothetical protein